MINYNANGGQGGPESTLKEINYPVALSGDMPVRDGYVFVGWSRSQNAVTADFQPNESVEQNNIGTLYAVWLKIDYVLPSTLTRIEDEAFANIENLVVFIPDTVAYISDTAFSSSVTVVLNNNRYVEDRCEELGWTLISNSGNSGN